MDRKSSNIEENLDIENLDLAEVVLKYQTSQEEARQTRLRLRQEADRRLKPPGRRDRRKTGGGGPTLRPSPLTVNTALVDGIPEGVAAQDYIKYRKCLYMDTVREWREQISSSLSPPVIGELQQLVTRLFK